MAFITERENLRQFFGVSYAGILSESGRYVAIDVLLQTNYDRPSEVTDHPVEDAGTAADNSRVLPEIVTINALVTGFYYTQDLLPSIEFLNTAGSAGQRLAWSFAEEQIKAIQEENRPFTLFTDQDEFENMQFLNYRRDTDKDTSDGLFFTATFKKVEFGVVETTQNLSADTERTGYRGKSNGVVSGEDAQTGTPDDPLNAGGSTSTLKQLSDVFGVFGL